eukprot:COSAG01_NODE_4758_length_4761_cov_54.944444_5_plen_108_part_00
MGQPGHGRTYLPRPYARCVAWHVRAEALGLWTFDVPAAAAAAPEAAARRQQLGGRTAALPGRCSLLLSVLYSSLADSWMRRRIQNPAWCVQLYSYREWMDAVQLYRE